MTNPNPLDFPNPDNYLLRMSDHGLSDQPEWCPVCNHLLEMVETHPDGREIWACTSGNCEMSFTL